MNLEYVVSAVLLFFIVTVLYTLWRREHPRQQR